MPTVPDIHRRGLRADQPAAADVTIGTLYFVTDEDVTERSDGTAWETYSAAAAGGGGAAANDAEYLVAASHAGLTAERVTTNTSSITWDHVAPGVAKANVVDGVVRPADHAMYHETGGSDALVLDRLAPPTDITTLNASTTAHGLLPKLSGTAGQFLTGTGAWAVPSVLMTDFSAPASPVDGQWWIEATGSSPTRQVRLAVRDAGTIYYLNIGAPH